MEYVVMSEIGDRNYNADCLIASSQKGIFILADGAGNNSYAKRASNAAAHTAYDILSKNGMAPKDSILSAMKAANNIREDVPGALTTLDILVINGSNATIGHVGDARIFLVRGRDLYQLTKDHADGLGYVENMIGMDFVQPDIIDSYVLEKDDLIAMMTDGVYKTLGKHQLNEILLKKDESIEQKKHSIDLKIKSSMESGLMGPQDNYSLIFIRC